MARGLRVMAVAAVAGVQAALAAQRPNILFALADDWSYGHAGAYGCAWVKTPAFDRVARAGVLFTQAYTPTAKCAPSRASILTGRNPWQTPRDEALQAINQELAAIAMRVAPLGVQTRLVRAKDLGDTKLIVENDANQVKIEVNVVFRGSVLPVERRPLSAKTSDLFGVEFELPVLAPDELYASKLVAALDRQHPRDLFDVWQLYESGDISDGMVECFVIYLAGHNRPPHEVLFGNDKDIAGEYERAFVGMTEVDCSLETLLDARARLRRELPQRLSTAHKQFLSGLARAEPDWSLVQCQHAAQLPALRWKLANLETFRKRRPDDFAAQSAALDTGLGQS